MTYYIILYLFIANILINPFICKASEDGTIVKAASTMSMEMHTQLLQHLPDTNYEVGAISIIATTPAMIDDLTKTNTLAKQFTEELMHNFVKLGYRVKELRKGEQIRIEPQTGELILTRDSSQLASKTVTSEAILAGTYTITNKNIRFNMRLLHTPSNDILAMSSATIPITKEISPLLKSSNNNVKPSVQTKLP